MARQHHRFTKDSDAVAADQVNWIFNCEDTDAEAFKTSIAGHTWVELVADADVPAYSE